ncbi:MAG: protease pro-enzyme activation domain-containing protein, partial [Chloroflexota bacterium]|nr:protease pro-enzyme activation domain-containing protein [Chloroflexota bacterium]
MYNLITGPRDRRHVIILLLLAIVAGTLPPRPAPIAVSAAVTMAVIGGGGPSGALPRGAHVLGPLPGSTSLRLIVGLSPRHQDVLDAFLRSPSAGSPRPVLSAEDYARLFGPTASAEDAVTSYLGAHGVRVVRRYRDRLLLDVMGTAAHVADAFGSPIVRYRDTRGRVYYANLLRPRLPAALAPLVATVVGLRDDAPPRHGPAPRMTMAATIDHRPSTIDYPRHGLAPRVTIAAARTQGDRPRHARGVTPPPPTQLTPANIQAAYDIAPLYTTVFTSTNGLTTTAAITGGGQTIALYELSPFDPKDIAAYDAAFGIAAAPPISI